MDCAIADAKAAPDWPEREITVVGGVDRFAEMGEWGVNYLRLTFSDLAQQTYFAENVLREAELV